MVIQFSDWCDSVFRPLKLPDWWHSEDPQFPEEGLQALTYLTRLFRESGTFPSRYSIARIARGLWFLCNSSCSDYTLSLVNDVLPLGRRLTGLRSILSLYSDLFARCGHALAVHDDDTRISLNNVCFMFWDMSHLSASTVARTGRESVEACLEVLSATLQLDNRVCKEAALHGLGHWWHECPQEVESIVESFLKNANECPREVIEYAECAKRGCVE